MILHLIRHPKPLIDPGICYGRLDIPAENAMAAAERLRAELPPGLPLWSSPLRRCRDLAELLHPAPVFDERLVEMDFGRWEGRPWESIPRAELDAWAADVAGYPVPGGESVRQVQWRAVQSIEQIAVPEAVVVSHGGVIRALLAYWLALDAAGCLALKIDYLSITSVEIGADVRILRGTNQ